MYRPRSNKKCKMQVFRRKWICQYIEQKIVSGCMLDEAFAEIEEEMRRAYGRKWTLNQLVVWLTKISRESRRDARY